MSKTRDILDLLAKSPGLSIDAIAEKLQQNRTKCGALVSNMLTRKLLASAKIDGSTMKTYAVAAGAPQKPAKKRKAKKPAKTSYKKLAKKHAARQAPLEFHCGVTADNSLIIIDPDTLSIRKFNPEQTNQLAELVFAHFDQQ